MPFIPTQRFIAVRRRRLYAGVPKLAPRRRSLRAVIRGDFKLIWGSDGNHELYDLAEDPAATRDLLASPEFRIQRETFTRLIETFVEIYGGSNNAGAPVLLDIADEETQEALRSLGYFGVSARKHFDAKPIRKLPPAHRGL